MKERPLHSAKVSDALKGQLLINDSGIQWGLRQPHIEQLYTHDSKKHHVSPES